MCALSSSSNTRGVHTTEMLKKKLDANLIQVEKPKGSPEAPCDVALRAEAGLQGGCGQSQRMDLARGDISAQGTMRSPQKLRGRF